LISTRKWLITLGAIAVGLFLLAAVVHAEEPYDLTSCGSGTNTLLYSSKELTILSTDSMGIAFSNHENKIFDNSTYHCAGTVRIAEGKLSVHIYCKYVNPDGEIVVGESTIEGTEAQWKFLLGTGKWKGITGGGTHTAVTRGKPVVAGTSQGCRRATGTYSLPQTQ
jgi:hypothetical protein